MVKKISAARIIQKYFLKKLKGRFSWTRYMPGQDESEFFKLALKSNAKKKLQLEQAERNLIHNENSNNNNNNTNINAEEEAKERRASDFRRVSQSLAINKNSVSLTARGKFSKSIGQERTDTVMIEGVEMPIAFLNTKDEVIDNEEEEFFKTRKNSKLFSEIEDSTQTSPTKELPTTNSDAFKPRKDLGFRGYETPMKSDSPKLLKRVSSAMPLSNHLHPVRIISKESRSMDFNFTTKNNTSRPTTAPNLISGSSPVEFSKSEINKLSQSQSCSLQEKEKTKIKKQMFYREVDDNINRSYIKHFIFDFDYIIFISEFPKHIFVILLKAWKNKSQKIWLAFRCDGRSIT
jgi:hypothetical protein